MPGFQWDLAEDIALCIEVCKVRPEKPLQWLEIAEVLNLKFTTESREVQLKGQGCKERLLLLIKKYNDEDVRALKRSGTDDEYDELSQLLEDIKCYMHDFEQQKATEKSRSDGKKEKDKRKGEEMRNAAMECMSKKRLHTSRESSPVLDSDQEEDDTLKDQDDDFTPTPAQKGEQEVP